MHHRPSTSHSASLSDDANASRQTKKRQRYDRGVSDMPCTREFPNIPLAAHSVGFTDASVSNFLIHEAVLASVRSSGVECAGMLGKLMLGEMMLGESMLGELMQTADSNCNSAKMAALSHSDIVAPPVLDISNFVQSAPAAALENFSCKDQNFNSAPSTTPSQAARTREAKDHRHQHAVAASSPAHCDEECDDCDEAPDSSSDGISTPPTGAPVAPLLAPSVEKQEDQRDEFEAFNAPVLLLGPSMDQAECVLAHAPNLSSGEASLQCNFIVHANFRRRCHPHDRATCRLCGQHGAVLACDRSVLVEGQADPEPLAAGVTVHVRILYGVISAGPLLTGLKALGRATVSSSAGPVFRMWIPENELQRSRDAGLCMCRACAGARAQSSQAVSCIMHMCTFVCIGVHVCIVL